MAFLKLLKSYHCTSLVPEFIFYLAHTTSNQVSGKCHAISFRIYWMRWLNLSLPEWMDVNYPTANGLMAGSKVTKAREHPNIHWYLQYYTYLVYKYIIRAYSTLSTPHTFLFKSYLQSLNLEKPSFFLLTVTSPSALSTGWKFLKWSTNTRKYYLTNFILGVRWRWSRLKIDWEKFPIHRHLIGNVRECDFITRH